jgi:hypothetical protein
MKKIKKIIKKIDFKAVLPHLIHKIKYHHNQVQ